MPAAPPVPGTSWFAQHELTGGLTAFTEPHVNPYFRANFYLLNGRDRDLLVDSGMGLAPLAPVLPTTPGKPVLAFASHIHADHVGSLHEFSDRAGPRLTADAFAAMDDRFTFADMFRVMDAPVSQLPSPEWKAADYAIAPAPLTTALEEGDTIDVGDRLFTVVHLPGHSFDSIALLDQRDGLLFSGDAVYDEELIDDLWCSDRDAYRATMRRLLELDVRLVLGGHGEPFDGARMHAIARSYLDRT